MFWGLHVKASPKIAQPLEYLFSESVKLSQVALEPPMSTKFGKANTPNGTKSKKDKNQSLVESPQGDNQKLAPVSLMVEHDGKQFVLCTLDPSRNWQCPLDLVFQAGTSVKFSLRGHGTLHLTGYEIPEEMDDDDSDMISFDEEDDENEDSEQYEMEVNSKAKPDKKAKGKKALTNGVAKGQDGKKTFVQEPIFLAKQSPNDEDDDESSEDLDFEAESDDDDDDEESDMEEDSGDVIESDESEDE